MENVGEAPYALETSHYRRIYKVLIVDNFVSKTHVPEVGKRVTEVYSERIGMKGEASYI